jgi:beta-xylosidase
VTRHWRLSVVVASLGVPALAIGVIVAAIHGTGTTTTSAAGVGNDPRKPSAVLSPESTAAVAGGDFPDPFVLSTDQGYLGFASNTNTFNIPVLRSSDLRHWVPVGDALPKLPSWAVQNTGFLHLTWSPSILARPGRYVLYYTAGVDPPGVECISRAVAAQPQGPYLDDSTRPFLCQSGLGGDIDPSSFVDADGTPYLVWKSDGNCCGKPTTLFAQQLTDDGLSLTGSAIPLVRNNQLWEGAVIESPAIVRSGKLYYVFYSANDWNSAHYAIGYSVCASPLGPCAKPLNHAVFTSQGLASGPGGEQFFTDRDGQPWMVFHAWTPPDIGYPDGARTLHLLPVTFVAGTPQF